MTNFFRAVPALFAMGRPLFVLGIFPFYALGLALAWNEARHLDWRLALLGFGTVLAVQLMTHYINEYWDVTTDQANITPTRLSGGSRTLVAGLVEPKMALVAARVAFVASGILGGYLFWERGVVAFALWAVAAFIGWFYSAPPLRLAARGLGEVLIAVTSALLVPSMAYYLQRQSLSLVLVGLGLPSGLAVLALTLATEFPDMAADAATGKATLPVRWGLARAARLHDRAMALAYLAPVAGMLSGLPLPTGWLFLAVAPLVMMVVRLKKTSPDPVRLERLCLMDAALSGLCPLLLAAGILMGLA